MDSHNVTFACDDESSLKLTKVFLNKNLIHCYHNNRGYCSFRDKCRYQHFSDICDKNICREKECRKRHPVICRYKDECKFFKTKNCAFKHQNTKRDVASENFQRKIKIFTDDIELLKSEIKDLKMNINTKEKELAESRIEIQQLKLKLTLKPNKQQEEDLRNENNELKKQIDILENKNKALEIKPIPINKAPTKDEGSEFEHGDEDNSKLRTKVSCKKCGLHFSSKEALKKHDSDMHKVKLTF